jgi:hypothetical protein
VQVRSGFFLLRPDGGVRLEIFDVEWLSEHGKAECSHVSRIGCSKIDVASNEDDAMGQLRTVILEPAEEVEATLGSQPDVDEDSVDVIKLETVDGLGDGLRRVHRVPVTRERCSRRAAQRLFVVDKQNGCHEAENLWPSISPHQFVQALDWLGAPRQAPTSRSIAISASRLWVSRKTVARARVRPPSTNRTAISRSFADPSTSVRSTRSA